MLGERIEDPLGVEGREEAVEGLGLLAVTTEMAGDKSTHRVKAVARRAIPLLGMDEGTAPLTAYEIHMGRSRVRDGEALLIVERDGREAAVPDGALREEPLTFGCYLHGLFENRAVREGFLNFLSRRRGLAPLSSRHDWETWRMERLDRLAGIVASSLDMDRIYALLGQ